MEREASKPFGWSPLHYVHWATVQAMIDAAGLPEGASFIDVGCGSGWTSLFLAEAGYDVAGYDLVPANVALAQARARRWGASARFEVADMEELPAGEPVDAALVLDALHHSAAQARVLIGVGRRLKPGGWLFIGEPTWIHRFSPAARAVHRDRGWLERGVKLRDLHADCTMRGSPRSGGSSSRRSRSSAADAACCVSSHSSSARRRSWHRRR